MVSCLAVYWAISRLCPLFYILSEVNCTDEEAVNIALIAGIDRAQAHKMKCRAVGGDSDSLQVWKLVLLSLMCKAKIAW